MLELMSNYLSMFIGAFITTVVALIFVNKILGKKLSINYFILSLLIIFVSAVTVVLSIFDFSCFKAIISCVLFIILFNYTFKTTFYESLLYSIMIMVLLTISEIFTFLLFVDIVKVNSYYLYNVLAASVLSNIIVSFIAILISLLFRKLLRRISDIKIKNYLTFYLILLFICIIVFFYATFSNIGHGINVLSGIAVIIVLLVVTSSLIIQSYRNNELTIKYDKLLEFIKKYEIEIDNQRTMRHEIKNQLLTIKSKIIDNDNNQNIVNYIDEILKDNSKEINHTIYAKLGHLPTNGIKGLFYFKVSEATDKNIDVNINISKNIEKSTLNNLNSLVFNQIGKILGILLDNAIEASELAKKKEIGIEIYAEKDKVNFIISNTYVGKIESGPGMFSRSTKGINRGHGLLLARAIVNGNNKFKLDTEITDDLYIQKLIIKK